MGPLFGTRTSSLKSGICILTTQSLYNIIDGVQRNRVISRQKCLDYTETEMCPQDTDAPTYAVLPINVKILKQLMLIHIPHVHKMDRRQSYGVFLCMQGESQSPFNFTLF